ncbi:MAG: sel1 repeat family protein, partial [Alistipes sp.]|nr:sel1 repeat family protein [Alistipes sp.]
MKKLFNLSAVRLFVVALFMLCTPLAAKAQSFEEYKTKAEQGDAEAQNSLGICYFSGYGVAQSYAEAVKWWRLAADQGYTFAQCNLGLCYYNGYGVAQSSADAVKWWRLAADQGYAEAQ